MSNRRLNGESGRTYRDKLESGFFARYMSGNGLDIGYAGHYGESDPILDTATGIDLDYPGYNGVDLPFATSSQDYVFSSHTLEHIRDYKTTIQEWFRVLRVNGHMVIAVPHKFLYEKKASPPSSYNHGHHRFYTPASLLAEIEESLTPNTYRVRLLEDGDKGFNYSIPPDTHSDGQYEITLVIQKIQPPTWSIA